MATRMTVGEKFQHYFGRLSAFELKKGWGAGKYTASEYLFMLLLGLWLAYFLPTFIPLSTLFSAAQVLTGIYVLYLLLLFFLSGGLGRVVDVI